MNIVSRKNDYTKYYKYYKSAHYSRYIFYVYFDKDHRFYYSQVSKIENTKTNLLILGQEKEIN